VASYDDIGGGSGAIVNQVQYAYDGWRNVAPFLSPLAIVTCERSSGSFDRSGDMARLA
jgi:hypothetical protein